MGSGRPSDSTAVKRITALLGSAALLLMLIGGISYREWMQFSRANSDGARSRETDAAVEALLSSLIDAESGQRGFLLTGEERYLEPYERAVQDIPIQLARTRELLARHGGSGNAAHLDKLVNQKLTELQRTIELRRTQGASAALALVLSDQGKRAMDDTRTLCAAILRGESTLQNRASAEGEAAARTALLVTVVGSLVLLFFFAVGIQPFASAGPGTRERPWFLRYGAAVFATAAATVLRMALTPLVGATAVPFVMFFPAVLFAAWFGGFRSGSLSVVLSVLASSYYFLAPTGSFQVANRADLIGSLVFMVSGFGAALITNSQRNAVERADKAQHAEQEQRQRLATTLGSIGDAVIATDAQGCIVFANAVAQKLLRLTEDDLAGRHLEDVFRIINEFTRAKVENPVAKVLREGTISGLANHTVLIAHDGTEIPIDDSVAPIRVGRRTDPGYSAGVPGHHRTQTRGGSEPSPGVHRQIISRRDLQL